MERSSIGRIRWRQDVFIPLIGIVGLTAGLWATWMNFSVAQAASQELSEEPSPIPIQETKLQLPAYAPRAENSAIARETNLETIIPVRSRVGILRYSVQIGDSVFGIANRYDLTPESILWGNFDLLNDDPHMLQPGQELTILPVNGAYYQWKEGDSLESVASTFAVDVEEIVGWPGNNLDPVDPEIEPDTWLIVPGGQRPLRQWFVPTIARGSTGTGTGYGPGACSGEFTGVFGTGGFIWPTPTHEVTGNDYWSGHLAIDLAIGVGQAVVAADSGVVVFSGWANGGYGNMVMLDHGNGWQTLYAHLSQAIAGCGRSVYQGQTIGLGGSTGNSTGPHLHFETRYQGGFVNPWFVLP